MPVTHFTFKCPYCFQEVDDDKVHFRAPYMNDGEFAWPDGEFHESAEDFRQNYAGDEEMKQEVLKDYQNWAFFAPRDDEEYEKFWGRYCNIYTEDDFFERVSPGSIPPRKRRVLNPANPAHWPYLKPVRGDGQTVDDYLVLDRDNMVSEIYLYDGARCNQRVCPFCHNPLPGDYGKYETKFIAMVGGIGSGKTVYLSQLLKHMSEYANKNGLAALTGGTGPIGFLKQYPVQLSRPVPEPTFPRFEQPLYYELTANAGNTRSTKAIVLYDVGGEVFIYRYSLRDSAPFLLNADGVIMLIEPNQFPQMAALSETPEENPDTITPYEPLDNIYITPYELWDGIITPCELLDSIYKVVSSDLKQEPNAHNQSESGRFATSALCETPIAVCLSKSDMASVRVALGEDLYRLIAENVKGIKGSDGLYRTQFNARQYNQILDGLAKFFNTHDEAFSHMMYSSYYKYAYFAVTALGCPCKVRQDRGSYPAGPVISPHRIEEPLLWLLYEFGYTDANEHIHYPSGRSKCPECGSCNTREYKPPKENWIARISQRNAPPQPNRVCDKCGNIWYAKEETRRRP